MKNSLYHIAGFLILVWAIVFLSFNTNQNIHFLLVIAGILILVRIFLEKIFSGKSRKNAIVTNTFKT